MKNHVISQKGSNGSRFFFRFVIVACLITVVAFSICHKSHIESINHIINCQDEQSHLMDSLLTAFHNRIEDFTVSKEAALKGIISDPLLDKLPSLSSKESKNIAKYVETAITAASSEYILTDALKDYESFIIANRCNQLQSDMKSLLELEMSKIQNEHETLGIWAALLTIVFLIFSFYSLFKADDLVKQGQDGLDKLNEIRREADNSVDQIKSKGEEKINKFEDDCKTALINAESQVNNVLEMQEYTIRRREKVIKDRLQREISDITTQIERGKAEVDQYYTKIIEEFKERESKQRHLDLAFNTLETRLNLLEQKFNSIKIEINESIKDKSYGK